MWSVRTNEWHTISARNVHTKEWRAVSARHVVVDMTSRRSCSRSETIVDNGLRGRWRNTPLHLSFALRGDFRIHTLKVHVPYPSVVFRREVLGKVIGNIFSSLFPVQSELVLLGAAAHPVETHIKIFRALSAHIAVEDAVGGCAVCFDQGGKLWVAHFNEGCADGYTAGHWGKSLQFRLLRRKPWRCGWFDIWWVSVH